MNLNACMHATKTKVWTGYIYRWSCDDKKVNCHDCIFEKYIIPSTRRGNLPCRVDCNTRFSHKRSVNKFLLPKIILCQRTSSSCSDVDSASL